jgi:hypothetical protein
MRIHVTRQRFDGVLPISIVQMHPYRCQRREIDDWESNLDSGRRDALVGWTRRSDTPWIDGKGRTQNDNAGDEREAVSNYQTAARPSWLH